MPDIVTSADVKTLMQAANFAAFRTSLGLTALATTTPGTGVATALAINVGSAGAFLTFNGNAGTPSALVGTNITGTAAGLTAGSVTNGVTAAANAAGAGLLWTSGGADKTAVATDTVTTINATTANVTNLLPVANDGAAIGASGTAFSDVFLASGAVINFNAGNLTLTHSAGILTSNGAYVGTTGTFSATTSLLLGTAGSAVGNIGFRNATSGTITVAPTTGALGTVTLTLPAVTATVCAAATSTTTTQALFATSTAGAPAYRAITAADITAGALAGTITLGEGTQQIALDPALSADGTYSGIIMTGTAGYTQAFGDVVYLDPTDSRWEACDANSAAGADGDCRGTIGMVVVAGTDGNSCTILLRGKIRADANFPSFTINNPIYISETAGDVTQTQPTTADVVIRIIGAALTADEMLFMPDNMWITHT